MAWTLAQIQNSLNLLIYEAIDRAARPVVLRMGINLSTGDLCILLSHMIGEGRSRYTVLRVMGQDTDLASSRSYIASRSTYDFPADNSQSMDYALQQACADFNSYVRDTGCANLMERNTTPAGDVLGYSTPHIETTVATLIDCQRVNDEYTYHLNVMDHRLAWYFYSWAPTTNESGDDITSATSIMVSSLIAMACLPTDRELEDTAAVYLTVESFPHIPIDGTGWALRERLAYLSVQPAIHYLTSQGHVVRKVSELQEWDARLVQGQQSNRGGHDYTQEADRIRWTLDPSWWDDERVDEQPIREGALTRPERVLGDTQIIEATVVVPRLLYSQPAVATPDAPAAPVRISAVDHHFVVHSERAPRSGEHSLSDVGFNTRVRVFSGLSGLNHFFSFSHLVMHQSFTVEGEPRQSVYVIGPENDIIRPKTELSRGPNMMSREQFAIIPCPAALAGTADSELFTDEEMINAGVDAQNVYVLRNTYIGLMEHRDIVAALNTIVTDRVDLAAHHIAINTRTFHPGDRDDLSRQFAWHDMRTLWRGMTLAGYSHPGIWAMAEIVDQYQRDNSNMPQPSRPGDRLAEALSAAMDRSFLQAVSGRPAPPPATPTRAEQRIHDWFMNRLNEVSPEDMRARPANDVISTGMGQGRLGQPRTIATFNNLCALYMHLRLNEVEGGQASEVATIFGQPLRQEMINWLRSRGFTINERDADSFRTMRLVTVIPDQGQTPVRWETRPDPRTDRVTTVRIPRMPDFRQLGMTATEAARAMEQVSEAFRTSAIPRVQAGTGRLNQEVGRALRPGRPILGGRPVDLQVESIDWDWAERRVQQLQSSDFPQFPDRDVFPNVTLEVPWTMLMDIAFDLHIKDCPTPIGKGEREESWKAKGSRKGADIPKHKTRVGKCRECGMDLTAPEGKRSLPVLATVRAQHKSTCRTYIVATKVLTDVGPAIAAHRRHEEAANRAKASGAGRVVMLDDGEPDGDGVS